MILLHLLAIIIYFESVILYSSSLKYASSNWLIAARVTTFIGAIAHFAAIGSYCRHTGLSPYASGFGTLSVASWIIIVTYLPVEILFKMKALGDTAVPAAMTILCLGMFKAQSGISAGDQVRTGLTNWHVALVLFSFALFVLSAACAMLYLWQYGLLKRPDKQALYKKLPPLERVDNLAYKLVAIGVPIMTVGLALGFVDVAGTKSSWKGDFHLYGSLLVWCIFATYLGIRQFAGYRGAKVNYLLIAGVVFSVLLYLLPSTIHHFL